MPAPGQSWEEYERQRQFMAKTFPGVQELEAARAEAQAKLDAVLAGLENAETGATRNTDYANYVEGKRTKAQGRLLSAEEAEEVRAKLFGSSDENAVKEANKPTYPPDDGPLSDRDYAIIAQMVPQLQAGEVTSSCLHLLENLENDKPMTDTDKPMTETQISL